MAEDEAKKAEIQRLKSQLRAIEDHTEKQLDEYNKQIKQWERSVEAAKERRDNFENDMRDKKREIEHKIRNLED